MKSTKEMIEVMQAYESGERIQVKNIADNTKWKEIEFPGWNWIYYDYRMKPKSKYIPFETVIEFLQAQRDHGLSVKRIEDGILFNLFINEIGNILLINGSNKIEFTNMYVLYDKYEFADGTPCGKEVAL